MEAKRKRRGKAVVGSSGEIMYETGESNETEELRAAATEGPSMPDHFSYSSLREFKDCPGKWYEKRILGKDEPESDPLILGKMMHDLTAVYERECLNQKVPTRKSQIGAILDGVIATHPEAVHLRGELAKLFSDYVERTIVEDELIGIETWVQTKIKLDGRAYDFGGYIDRVYNPAEGHYGIVDYKTDGAIRSQAEADKDFQLRCYALLIHDEVKDADLIDGGLEFLRYGITRWVEGLQDTVEDTRAEIAQRISIIEEAFATSDFPYKVGHACSMCGLAPTCQALKDMAAERGNLVVVDEKDAKLAAVTLIALEERKKHITELLKSYCSAHGNIVTAGKEVGFRVRESYDYPVPLLLGVLDKFDLEHVDYLKADSTALKKAAKGNADLEKELEDIREDKSTTTFGMVKAKE